MKKKVLCLILGLILTFSQVMSVSASQRKQELQQEKAAAQSQLSAENSKIDNLEEKKNAIMAEIDQLDQDLVNILVQIDVLKGELEAKEAEIVQTQEDLKVAEQDRDQQYEDMKKRIQYLYENGGNDAWAQMLLQAEDLPSLLNQAEYVQKMYDSDRKSLDAFKETVQEVADLGEMQREYENQQADLERQLTDKKATSSDYEAQIANAESQAAELVSLINKQNAEIRQIEEEEKKAAEEAARKAAEEAAKKAAAEEAAKKAAAEEAEKQQTANSNKPSASTGNGSSQKPQSGNQSGNTNTNNNNSNNNTNNNNNQGNDTQKEDNSSKDESAGSNVPYNPTGAAVVNYACQFVGNPYVYGGNSLTNGTDCSGFIKLVYGHFGVSLPRSSGAMQSVGRAVPYSQAMPGDIICYSGHVALYMGGGQIVHASNSAPYPKGGIKISPNAAYQTILTVRRVL